MGYRKHPIGAGMRELRKDSTGDGRCTPNFLTEVKGARPGRNLVNAKRGGMPYPGSPAPGGSKPSGSKKPHPSGVGSRLWHR